MSTEDLKRKIQESLQRSGISSDQIELDKAVRRGDPEAMYRKACTLLNRQDCKIDGNPPYWQEPISRRMEWEGTYVPSGQNPYGEWYQLLEESALKGCRQALEDILVLYENPPYIQDCPKYFLFTQLGSKHDELRYVDEFGDDQPYAFRLAQMLLFGRIHFPSPIDRGTFDPSKGMEGKTFFDGKEDGTVECFYPPTKGRNVISEDFKKAIKLYKKAAELGSRRALSRLAFIYLSGLKSGKLEIKQNKKTGLEFYNQLQALGGYTYKKIILAKDNPIKSVTHVSKREIGELYYTGAPGVKTNIDLAINWLTKAAEDGDEQALKKLQEILERIEKKSTGGFFSKLFGK